MRLRIKRATVLALILTCSTLPTRAQNPNQDHSDVSTDPRGLEIWPGAGRPLCFPLTDPTVRVSVSVYDVEFVPNAGDGSVHRPNAEMQRYLSDAIQSAFPNWTLVQTDAPARLRLDVAVFRERDAQGDKWSTFTTWGGTGLMAVERGCALPRSTYRTDDLKAAMDHIVRQMLLGEDMPDKEH